MRAVHNSGFTSSLYDWLASPDTLRPADVIFVLAGGQGRKRFGLRLLQEGWAGTLLLSVARFDIRRFSALKLPLTFDLRSIASATEPRRRHYFIATAANSIECRPIPVGRLGTLSEVIAFSNWLKANDTIRSAIIISSGFHLRRLRLCCRNILRDRLPVSFVARIEDDRRTRGRWWRHSKMRDIVVYELFKIGIYAIIGLRFMNWAGTGLIVTADQQRCTKEENL